MSEEEDNKIKDRLHQIFPDPQVASNVVDLVVHNRPRGWSSRSNAPYYKEIYARWIKKEIDKMILSGKELIFKYDKFCGEEQELMSRQTLYNRINQSIRYLVEQIDTPDRKYGKWYETVAVNRSSKVGVSISFIAGFGEGNEMTAEEVVSRKDMPIWRRELDEWLEGDSVRPFCKEGLLLNEADIVQLKDELGQLSNIVSSINYNSVKVIKIK